MKAGRGESISTGSVEQLELLASQVAQVDEVALHLVAVDYLRVDGYRERAAYALKLLNVAAVCARSEVDHLLADDLLFELFCQRSHLLAQRVALALDVLPLGLVAVECLENEVQLVFVQLALVILERLLDRLQFALQCRVVCVQPTQTLVLSLAHSVHKCLIVVDKLLYVELLLEQDVGLDSLEVVDHVAALVDLGERVEQLRQLVEALLGRLMLSAVAYAQQMRNVIVGKELSAVVGKIVNLLAEMALDHLSARRCEVVVLHQHRVDVSGTRSLATRKNARIGVHAVAAGELAHHQLFQIHFVG